MLILVFDFLDHYMPVAATTGRCCPGGRRQWWCIFILQNELFIVGWIFIVD
jgi:hypothetical protein